MDLPVLGRGHVVGLVDVQPELSEAASALVTQEAVGGFVDDDEVPVTVGITDLKSHSTILLQTSAWWPIGQFLEGRPGDARVPGPHARTTGAGSAVSQDRLLRL